MAGYLSGLLLFCVVGLCSSADPVCVTQINTCSCETDQGLIDLSPLDSGDPNAAKFTNIPDAAGNTFAYNPCSPFTDISSYSCVMVAACQTRAYDTYNIGEQTNAVFETDPTDGLRIKYPSSDGIRQTYVALKCDESQEGILTAIGEQPAFSSTYHMTLTSKYACPAHSEQTTSGGEQTTSGGEQTTTPSGGHDDSCPRRYWLFLATILCIILALTSLGLVTYILCGKRSNTLSGGATMHSCNNDRVDDKTYLGYKRF